MLGRPLRMLAAAALSGAVLAATASAVVGGTAIAVQSAPWAVFVKHTSTSEFRCSGSVVDASHVLTAAHCLFDDACNAAAPASFQVRAGASNFEAPAAGDQVQDRSVASVRIHPGFTCTAGRRPGPDDVGVLVLSTPLDLGTTAVAAVALPAGDVAFPAGVAVAVAGFGLQSATSRTSGPLSLLTARVDEPGECGDGRALIPDNAIYLCAASPAGAICEGDSGGGLVTTSATNVLVGVVDATNGCRPGSHSLFAWTGAPEILDFIRGAAEPPTAPRRTTSTFVRLRWQSTARLYAGTSLSCLTGNWSDPQAHFTYAFVDAVTGTALQSGTSSTFVVPGAAVGKRLACRVGVENAGGTTLAATQATPAIRAAPRVRVVHVAPATASRGGRASLRVTVVAPPALHGKVALCVAPPAAVAARQCRSIVDGDGLAARVPFVVSFRVSPSAPLGAARLAITARAGASSTSASALLRVTR